MTQSRILARLNRETRIHHADAEVLRLALLERPQAHEYGVFLERMYGLHAPVESAFALTPGLAALIDLRSSAKAGLIAADLIALGYSAATVARLPLCCSFAPFDDVAEALGWLYALERSSFNIPDLRDQLEGSLTPQIETASRYLSSFDRDVMRDAWNELGDALDATATSQDIEQRIIDSTHDAYASQYGWLGEPVRRIRVS